MKKIISSIIVLLTASSLYAQQHVSAVTITVNGNRNLQIAADGKNYTLTNNPSNANVTTMALTNLAIGQHSLQLRRSRVNSNRLDMISTVFNLRSGFNMLIKLNNNGSLELIETKNNASANNHAPMNNTTFNTLLKKVKSQVSSSARRTLITNTFNNTNNYFTSNQVAQLIQQLNAESYRLQLAKLSYHTVTDPDNFTQVFDLLRSQSSREELQTYTENYYSENDTRMAMADTDFVNLLQSIRQQWPANDQQNSLINVFSNTNNYFSVAQARQLIQVAGSETNRLQLAKLSYRSITDPANFNEVYELLNNQSSKNELAFYVSNYNSGGSTNIAMTDAEFNTLYQAIEKQFFPNEQMNSLTNTFNNPAYYFTSAQARHLIELVSYESNRLQLAKLSYRTISDRDNFNLLFDLFNNQSSKNELDAYIKAYKA